jgi:hypothetical protein
MECGDAGIRKGAAAVRLRGGSGLRESVGFGIAVIDQHSRSVHREERRLRPDCDI